jgi:hypothetical protein
VLAYLSARVVDFLVKLGRRGLHSATMKTPASIDDKFQVLIGCIKETVKYGQQK